MCAGLPRGVRGSGRPPLPRAAQRLPGVRALRSPRGIAEAQRRLAAGEILAIKGLGGFHLACDARNAAAVERLRARKRRSDKPFALMVRDLAAARELCEVDDADRARAAAARSSPIVILPRRAQIAAARRRSRPAIRTLGVMLPYTPLHHLLFAGAPYDALVMTSGNLSEEPIVVDERGGARRASAGSPTGSCCTTATSTCAPTIRWCASSRASSA